MHPEGTFTIPCIGFIEKSVNVKKFLFGIWNCVSFWNWLRFACIPIKWGNITEYSNIYLFTYTCVQFWHSSSQAVLGAEKMLPPIEVESGAILKGCQLNTGPVKPKLKGVTFIKYWKIQWSFQFPFEIEGNPFQNTDPYSGTHRIKISNYLKVFKSQVCTLSFKFYTLQLLTPDVMTGSQVRLKDQF